MKKASILAAVLAAVLTVPAYAAETVKIGAILPLTGNSASAGQSAKDAIDLGVEIVNTPIPS